MMLRHATRADVRSAANRYLRSAHDSMHKGQWYERIAERIPDDTKTVEEVLSEADLATLRES